jgi:acetyl-CoA C-acetyltransferase
MAEAYIYDAVRTPRGKGKANGSLHEQTSLQLATQVLEAIRDRNNLDTSKVDDVYAGLPVADRRAGRQPSASLSSTPATPKPSRHVQVERLRVRPRSPATSLRRK